MTKNWQLQWDLNVGPQDHHIPADHSAVPTDPSQPVFSVKSHKDQITNLPKSMATSSCIDDVFSHYTINKMIPVNIVMKVHLTHKKPIASLTELKLMFKLMNRVPDGIQPMLDAMEEHIVSAGLADMVAAADTITQDSEQYVEKLLDLFQRFSRLVSEAFDEDPHFLTARDKAYKQVVNDTQVFKLELPSKTVCNDGSVCVRV